MVQQVCDHSKIFDQRSRAAKPFHMGNQLTNFHGVNEILSLGLP
jgi:hypothetical protein